MAVDPLLVLLALAFLPALLYLTILAFRHPGPSARLALSGFLYGATLSIVVLAFIYVGLAMLLGNPVQAFQAFFAERSVNANLQRDFIVIVVLAPVTEELAKGVGVWLLAGRPNSGRDGVMLGAAVGLGFAAVETFLYLLAALADSGSALAGGAFFTVLAVAIVRSFTAAFVHPAATAATGYGIVRARLRRKWVVTAALPYYLVAVALHGAYNYLAAFLPPQSIAGVVVEVNLLAAALLAAVAWGAVKRSVARAG